MHQQVSLDACACGVALLFQIVLRAWVEPLQHPIIVYT
jgi:hypothetical protein